MNKSGPFIRKRLYGQMSDGSDRQEVDETYWLAQYLDDNGQTITAEFAHDPQPSDIDALTPGRVRARQAVNAAVTSWQDAETAWGAATTTAQALAALHLEHVALMKAIRAVALLDQIDN